MDKSDTFDDAVIVALGSNLRGAYPTCAALLAAALEAFPAAGLTVARRSNWWRSVAWPDPTAPDYLNAIAVVETGLAPRALLAALLDIEAAFGRIRGKPNAARTLDLDLIAYGRLIVSEPGLTLPHPRAADRRFVMGPLAEIAPAWRHPVTLQTATDLAARAKMGHGARPASGQGRRHISASKRALSS